MLKKILILISIGLTGLAILNLPSFSGLIKADLPLDPVPSPIRDLKTYLNCKDHNPGVWHPAAEKDLSGSIDCVYEHEHGDAPPEWLINSGYKIGFDHHSGFTAGTSEYENTLKHAGMKGFSANIKGVDIYARIHLASNVLDRSSRYHSYELYLKDPSGNISHFQGWLDTGDPLKDRIPYRDSTAGEKGIDPRTRPIVWAATKHACQIDRTWCIELWAMKTWNWGPDLIWGINDATTFFKEGEENTPDINSWDKSGSNGTDRSLTVTIYRNPKDLKERGVEQMPLGEIWATQFGDIVSGHDDPLCGAESLKYGISYKNICLENYIAPTLPQITGVYNTAQKQFDSTGVELPN